MAKKKETAAKASWYAKGKEGVEKSKQEEALAKKKREQAQAGNWRFRLKTSEDAKFSFLDDPMFFFREHNLEIAGKFGNFYTCCQTAA